MRITNEDFGIKTGWSDKERIWQGGNERSTSFELNTSHIHIRIALKWIPEDKGGSLRKPRT